MTPIEWINQILIHKESWESFSESDRKTFNPYIINRFLSMDNDFIEIVNMFQSYSLDGMNLKYVYTFYCKILPKGKRYNKYIKNKNENKFNLELVYILCDYFEESSSNILDYIELTSKDKIKSILELYGLESKKIRKLIK